MSEIIVSAERFEGERHLRIDEEEKSRVLILSRKDGVELARALYGPDIYPWVLIGFGFGMFAAGWAFLAFRLWVLRS